MMEDIQGWRVSIGTQQNRHTRTVLWEELLETGPTLCGLSDVLAECLWSTVSSSHLCAEILAEAACRFDVDEKWEGLEAEFKTFINAATTFTEAIDQWRKRGAEARKRARKQAKKQAKKQSEQG